LLDCPIKDAISTRPNGGVGGDAPSAVLVETAATGENKLQRQSSTTSSVAVATLWEDMSPTPSKGKGFSVITRHYGA